MPYGQHKRFAFLSKESAKKKPKGLSNNMLFALENIAVWVLCISRKMSCSPLLANKPPGGNKHLPQRGYMTILSVVTVALIKNKRVKRHIIIWNCCKGARALTRAIHRKSIRNSWLVLNVACPIIFFVAGGLCCRANSIFAAGLTMRGHETDLFQAYWLIISCHFCFLQDLSLMPCSLSIFFGFGSRITTFKNYRIVYMMNLYAY